MAQRRRASDQFGLSTVQPFVLIKSRPVIKNPAAVHVLFDAWTTNTLAAWTGIDDFKPLSRQLAVAR